MATVYKLNVSVVSPFIAYPDDVLIKILTEHIAKFKDEETGLGLVCIEVKVDDK